MTKRFSSKQKKFRAKRHLKNKPNGIAHKVEQALMGGHINWTTSKIAQIMEEQIRMELARGDVGLGMFPLNPEEQRQYDESVKKLQAFADAMKRKSDHGHK